MNMKKKQPPGPKHIGPIPIENPNKPDLVCLGDADYLINAHLSPRIEIKRPMNAIPGTSDGTELGILTFGGKKQRTFA